MEVELLECSSCPQVTVSYLAFGPGPVAHFTATTTVAAPTTVLDFACSSYYRPRPSSAGRYWSGPGRFEEETVVRPPNMKSKPTCTSSTLQRAPGVPGPTITVWPATVTSTSTINCGNCALAWSTAAIQFLAAQQYTATVTAAQPSVKSNYACL
ncbi:hypothetical protein CDD80_4943 [Ophiocordyceps camponoti-rufipedis]|uniref:Uncharacterized protein n=1 Tax=Ophiocordyceps camponoti-rufipedis TaxID=2004952 RepID=A0A2C5ZIY4_9HYPO|nr:hypothetical protein CDD80_4943 [Ophiocordyceps camponoti-rufipedis]